MTPDEIRLVRESFALVLPIRDTAAELFYARLFETDTSASTLFAGADMPFSGTFEATGVPANLKTVWSVGLRMTFDWRYYW